MKWTPWWGTLLDGILGAALGGVVAAVTALIVVSLTSRKQLRHEAAREARVNLVALLVESEDQLDSYLREPESTGRQAVFRWQTLTPARISMETLGKTSDSAAFRVQCSKISAAGMALLEDRSDPTILRQQVHELRVDIKRILSEI